MIKIIVVALISLSSINIFCIPLTKKLQYFFEISNYTHYLDYFTGSAFKYDYNNPRIGLCTNIGIQYKRWNLSVGYINCAKFSSKKYDSFYVEELKRTLLKTDVRMVMRAGILQLGYSAINKKKWGLNISLATSLFTSMHKNYVHFTFADTFINSYIVRDLLSSNHFDMQFIYKYKPNCHFFVSTNFQYLDFTANGDNHVRRSNYYGYIDNEVIDGGMQIRLGLKLCLNNNNK